MRSALGPLHLLLFDHPPAHHLIDHRLHEPGADPFTMVVPLAIVHNRRRIIADIGLSFVQVLPHTGDLIALWMNPTIAIVVIQPSLQPFI